MCPPFLAGVTCSSPWINSRPEYLRVAFALIAVNTVMGFCAVIAAIILERGRKEIPKRNVVIHCLMFAGCLCRVLVWLVLFSFSASSSSVSVFFVFFLDFFGSSPTTATAFLLVLKTWWDAVSCKLVWLIPISIIIWYMTSITFTCVATYHASDAFFWNVVGHLALSGLNVAKAPLFFIVCWRLFKVSNKVRSWIDSLDLLKAPLLISFFMVSWNTIMTTLGAVGFSAHACQDGYFTALLSGQLPPMFFTFVYYTSRLHHLYLISRPPKLALQSQMS